MKNKSYLFAVLATLIWGSSAVIIKLLIKNLDSLSIVLYSSIFGFIGLFIITIFQKKFNIIKQYGFKDYLRFAYMSFIGTFLYNIFLNIAFTYLKAQEAYIINYLWPIMIIILAIPILKEKITIKKVIAIIISFIGLIIIATQGNINQVHFTQPIGIIFAILAAISYGLFSVLGKKQNDEKTTSMLFYYFFASIFSLIFTLVFYKIPNINGIQLLGLLYNGIFISAIASLFWFLALKNGDTSKISNIAFLTPFFSLIYIYFILHEKIQLYSIIGLCFIFIGIFLQNYNKK